MNSEKQQYRFRPENRGGSRLEPFGATYFEHGVDFQQAAEVLVRAHKELAGVILGVWARGTADSIVGSLAPWEFIGFLKVQ